MNLVNKMSVRLHRRFRGFLQLVFGFDRWHTSPVSTRAYAMDIIKYLNLKVNRNSIVEIGCGLGDIIRNVHYKTRFGFDAESNALNAARFLSKIQLSPFSTHFLQFVFPGSLAGQYDAIILVNWIHHIQPAILKESIHEYYAHNLQKEGVIIIDTVKDIAYKYNHEIEYLVSGIHCSVECIGTYERNRKVWAIKRKD